MGESCSPWTRPSIVVISSPPCITARLRQEFTRRPLTCTVQAPHWPWSHPFLVPVSTTVSRRQSRSVVRGSRLSRRSTPLMRKVTGTAPSTAGGGCGDGFMGCATRVCGPIAVATPTVPADARNARRLRRSPLPSFTLHLLHAATHYSDRRFGARFQMKFLERIAHDDPVAAHGNIFPCQAGKIRHQVARQPEVDLPGGGVVAKCAAGIA